MTNGVLIDRKLSLTDEGRLFYERCTGPLQEWESAQSAVKDKSRSPAGTLRVTSVSPFGRNYVLPLLPAFSRAYPNIQLEFHLDDAISDMIAQGYDVGIRAGEMRDGSMIARPIAPLHFVVCGSPSFAFLSGRTRNTARAGGSVRTQLPASSHPSCGARAELAARSAACGGRTAGWRQLCRQRSETARLPEHRRRPVWQCAANDSFGQKRSPGAPLV